MNLTLFQRIISSAKGSFLRFPTTVVAALIAACAGVSLVMFVEESSERFFLLTDVLLTFLLGIPLFFCASLTTKKHSSKIKLAGAIVILILLIAIFFLLPYSKAGYVSDQPYTLHTLLSLVAYLLVMVAPRLSDKQSIGCWSYNKTLFIQLILSSIYSGFLLVGITLALSILETLFNLTIAIDVYFSCSILIGVFFNTWVFVARVERKLYTPNAYGTPPTGLKLFTQYVLIPLLMLYLIILYVYGLRVVVFGVWPKGITAYMIASVASLGIAAHLLIFPYEDQTKHAWIKKYIRCYYYLLLPLIVMLFVSIGMRIADYGITINRYAVVLLGLWLTGICVYFLFGKADIRFIFTSLAAVLTLAAFGPWGMFQMSQHSQEKRLYNILTENNMIGKGQLQHETIWRVDSLPHFYPINPNINSHLLSDSLRDEVKSILNYLGEDLSLDGVDLLLEQNIDSLITAAEATSKKRVIRPEIYMRSLGLPYYGPLASNGGNGQCVYSDENRAKVIATEGYTHLVQVEGDTTSPAHELMTFSVAGTTYTIRFADTSRTDLALAHEGDLIRFGLDSLIRNLPFNRNLKTVNQHILDAPSMVVKKSSSKINIKFSLSFVEVVCSKNSIVSIEGQLWLSE